MHLSTSGSRSITAPIQQPPSPAPHPVRLRADDDLTRNRLTVFFRLLLAIPHFIWLGLWGIAVPFLAFFNWVATLIRGQSPPGLHRFLSAYVNYATHVFAYLYVAANRFPGFTGDPGYQVDVEFDPPARQNRWTVAFRIFLAIPALLLAAALIGSWQYIRSRSGGSSSSSSTGLQVTGVLVTAGVLAWFFSLFRGRAPEGITRLSWYALHYGAQTYAYLFLLTDRYPNSNPAVAGVPRIPPPHPISLREQEDTLVRSRLTVFFRGLLAIPHFVWLALWTVLVIVVAIANWVVTLIRGSSPGGLHRFLSAYQRYVIHVYAFFLLVANPFPGFTGTPGAYPVEVDLPPPERQPRITVAWRLVLAIPAIALNSALGTAALTAAILGWFASLFTGRMPRGLRSVGAFALRYGAQTSAYGYLLLTSRYPYAGPPAGADSLPEGALPAPSEPPPSAEDAFVYRTAAPDDPRGAWRDPPFLAPPETSG